VTGERLAAIALVSLAPLALPSIALAGPPYVTDDPEPVPLRDWEVYLASMGDRAGRDVALTAPHVEVNYGAAPGLQLHLLVPMALNAPHGGPTTWGPGDVEVGAKYRFLDETRWTPEAGTFPLLELPLGNPRRGLGNGQAQLFAPIWLQKSAGAWTSYGGGGWWHRPGPGHRHDGWLAGWQLQRELFDGLALGAEIVRDEADDDPDERRTRVNAGLVFDVTPHEHVLLSAGRALARPESQEAYAAFQWTFGPKTRERR